MGRLVGVGAKQVVKFYTEEEVKNLTTELEVKVQEVTELNSLLTEEKTILETKVQELENQVKELTEKKDKKPKEKE